MTQLSFFWMNYPFKDSSALGAECSPVDFGPRFSRDEIIHF